MFVARDDHFALAVKAGDNGDSHNHNDTGSVTLYKDGAPVLIDVGVERLHQEDLLARALHDLDHAVGVCTIFRPSPGVTQGAGEAFAARDVSTGFGPAESWIEQDIAGAYPPEAGLRSYRRRVRLLKGAGRWSSSTAGKAIGRPS